MTGYLAQLAARSLSLGDTVRPRVAAIFEPQGPVAETAAAWPQSVEERDADRAWHPPPPSGPPPPGTGRADARPAPPAPRQGTPVDGLPVEDRFAGQRTLLPAPHETETYEPLRPTGPVAGPPAPVVPSTTAGAPGHRTRAAQPGRRDTRDDSASPDNQPLRADSRNRVSPPSRRLVAAGENPAQPPAGELVAPALEAPAALDSIAFRPRERGAGSIPVPGIPPAPAVSLTPGLPSAVADHLPAPVTVRTRRSHPAALTSTGDLSQPPPTVHVTIGRVEVRAVTAPAALPRPDRERRPMVTLAEHLQAREARR